jgi:hypothetical protein
VTNPSPADLLASLRQLVDLVQQIQQALDLSGYVSRAIQVNLQTFVAFGRLIYRTEDPLHPGQPFTAVGPVRDFTHVTQAASDAALAIVLIWAFCRMLVPHQASGHHAARALLPRALLAVVLINLALPLVQAGVDACNVISRTIAADTFTADIEGLVRQPLNFQPDALQSVADAALFLGTLVLGIVYVVRFTLLVVLTILAPVAALLSILPEISHYAQEWSGLFVTTLMMQPLQLLLLEIGFALDRYGGLPIRHVFVLATLFLTFKVPGALGASTRVGGRSFTIVRREVNRAIRQVTRALEAEA